MNEQTLSGQEEQGLTPEQVFAEMSKAVRDGDDTALDRLTKDETPLEIEAPEVKVEDVKPDEGEAKPAAKAGEEDPNPDNEDPVKQIAQLKEELAKRDQLVHTLRSDAGRVPTLQRKLAEVDQKLREMAAKPTSAAVEKKDVAILSDKLAQIKEADPLLAEAVEEAIRSAMELMEQKTDSKLAETQKVLKERTERDEDDFLEKEYTKLIQAVPNAPEVFAHPLWEQWKSEIPPNLLSLARSPIADEVMVAFEQFTKYVLKRHPELANQTAGGKVEQEVKPDNAEAERLAAERDKKLKTPTPGTSRAVVKHDNEPTDPEKLFKHFYDQMLPAKR